ncbi:lytic transglycosylase domain-containing protein [Nocardia sp. NPDC020380]|uniref:lytic transglycosylase domain-containing protein n=1 Tax=Nocardia sp. NPDC020380 TaxID=3364309 RepID=UPI00378CDAB9
MGRHRKPPVLKVRRGSVIALAGLVPTGLATVTGASDSNLVDALTSTVHHQFSGDTDEQLPRQEAAAMPVAAPDPVLHEAKQVVPVAPPIVKTVAQPANRERANLPAGPLGVPGIAMAAYKNAEGILAAENPECHMSWSMLAGIGRVESTHGYGGNADSQGNMIEPVYGPVLDGSLAGNNVVHDSSGGDLDGLSGPYRRAVGPMQFLPETWRKYAADATGNGISDPQNMYDAALTAGKYLCDGGLDMRNPAQQTRAILRYNNSMAYVANVMAWESAYDTGQLPKQAALPRI